MNPPDPSLYNDLTPGWQLLGELKLANVSSTENVITDWLLKTLRPLNLQTDFLDRICESTKGATNNLLASNPSMQEFENIHVLVFAQGLQAAGQQTWGFFRIEKTENESENKRHRAHSVELYLYLEGA